MRRRESKMFEMLEVKDMNTEEAVALCKQEYMEELPIFFLWLWML